MGTSIIWVWLVCIGSVLTWEPSVVNDKYDLTEPTQTTWLEAELREISGLTYADGYLYCVQDEDGRAFQLDGRTGEILDSWKFWDKGDYEGMTVVDSVAYIIKSNGNIYETEILNSGKDNTTNYKLGYPDYLNFEGITYHPETESLLLIAKRRETDGAKEIFRHNLSDIQQKNPPVFVLDRKLLSDHHRSKRNSWTERLAFDISSTSYSFNPSGIAIHPFTEDIYILSSPVPQLLILNKKWKVKSIVFLDKTMFKQPESICFDPEGAMYIANEGQRGKASLLKFVSK